MASETRLNYSVFRHGRIACDVTPSHSHLYVNVSLNCDERVPTHLSGKDVADNEGKDEGNQTD